MSRLTASRLTARLIVVFNLPLMPSPDQARLLSLPQMMECRRGMRILRNTGFARRK
ncbi:hypothetical protein THICB3310113 [Thiomonas sp. CB3]|nr:hypothetical protein THICB3310113 [Thiomonas sp. CB3]